MLKPLRVIGAWYALFAGHRHEAQEALAIQRHDLEFGECAARFATLDAPGTNLLAMIINIRAVRGAGGNAARMVAAAEAAVLNAS